MLKRLLLLSSFKHWYKNWSHISCLYMYKYNFLAWGRDNIFIQMKQNIESLWRCVWTSGCHVRVPGATSKVLKNKNDLILKVYITKFNHPSMWRNSRSQRKSKKTLSCKSRCFKQQKYIYPVVVIPGLWEKSEPIPVFIYINDTYYWTLIKWTLSRDETVLKNSLQCVKMDSPLDK